MEQQISRIYLTGFMGCGKSSIGHILANTLGWSFMDLDKVIEQKYGARIAQIFKERGEEYFRTMETETLKETGSMEHIIVALGGGAIIAEENRTFMKSAGKLIYLRATPERLYARLRYKTDRPLFQTQDNVILTREKAIEKISRLLSEREHYYNQAHLIFDSADNSIGYSVEKLKSILLKTYNLEHA
jgi:shikimate kinase